MLLSRWLKLCLDLGLSAESIAFYQGEKREEGSAVGRLLLLVIISRLRILWAAGLNVWMQTHSYAVILLPYLLIAPRYFAGAIEFGVITQVSAHLFCLAWH